MNGLGISNREASVGVYRRGVKNWGRGRTAAWFAPLKSSEESIQAGERGINARILNNVSSYEPRRGGYVANESGDQVQSPFGCICDSWRNSMLRDEQTQGVQFPVD